MWRCKHDEFLADIKSLLESGKYSDLTITCQGFEWKVHKAIICSQSKVLEAATRFGKEEAENHIDLPEDQPEMVEYMLGFMYEREYRLPSDDAPRPFWIKVDWPSATPASRKKLHWKWEQGIWNCSALILERAREEIPDVIRNYEDKAFKFSALGKGEHREILQDWIQAYWFEDEAEPKGRTPTGSEDLIIHAKLYALADKYFIKGLKEEVCAKFRECMDASFGSRQFYEAVEIVFTTIPETDSYLRNLLVERVAQEKEKYTLKWNQALQDALDKIPGLANSLLRYEDEMQNK
ncbi:hypothetical protein ACEQ8H_001293 [Pleosporales sp. CAS-2024a]